MHRHGLTRRSKINRQGQQHVQRLLHIASRHRYALLFPILMLRFLGILLILQSVIRVMLFILVLQNFRLLCLSIPIILFFAQLILLHLTIIFFPSRIVWSGKM
ncbi:hypothetical protein V8F20_007593 [Naviculisporaceae sp. PSN 640]